MKKILYGLTFAACGMASQFANAVEPFRVADIQVRGIQRVDPSTIYAYLPIKVGAIADDRLIRESIQSLYSTSFFSDVNMAAEGNVLVLTVVERPFIASVSYSGNKELDADALKKIASDIGISDGRVFDKAQVAQLEQAIKAQYLSRSYYDVKINTVSSPLERNRVNLLLEITEGEIARIQEIKILGNKFFSEKTILGEMKSNTPTWTSWLSKSDRYSKEKVTADIELIRNFYLSKGFFEFAVESNQVSLSPDKKNVFLTIVLNEGEQYTINQIALAGLPPDQLADLSALNKIQQGSLFNGETFNDLISKLSVRLGELGYASAQINPVPQVLEETKQLNFSINIDPGARTYVRRVNITGNSRTRDSVIRREMLQFESSWYDAEKIRSSRDRIDRLGFFKDVTVDVANIEGKPDVVDINIGVVEKPTGNINFGVGYNSTDKVGLTAGIAQDNIFGTGNNISFNVNTAKSTRGIALSATDPYYTDSGISRIIDLYSRTNTLRENNVDRVKIDSRGASLKFGVPFTETDTVYFGSGVEYTGLKTFTGAPARYAALETNIKGSTTYPLLTVGWGNDTRDSALSPTRGTLKRANLELGVGTEIAYNKFNYQYQTYYALNKDFTLAGNADLGIGSGLGSKKYPFFKNFYAGGIGSVRGYQGNTLGPLDGSDHIGGARRLVLNAELLFPLPGSGKDRTAKLFTFIDGGYAWGESDKIRASDLRFSSGLGLSWLSPIGPLKFSYGLPLRKQTSDKLQKFQFQIGTGF